MVTPLEFIGHEYYLLGSDSWRKVFRLCSDHNTLPMAFRGDVATLFIRELVEHTNCTVLTQETTIYSGQLELESTSWGCNYTGTICLILDLYFFFLSQTLSP